jgi:hypothetical protein
MTRTFAALALACALLWPAPAGAHNRPRHGTFCAPVIAKGVGLVRICGIPDYVRGRPPLPIPGDHHG